MGDAKGYLGSWGSSAVELTLDVRMSFQILSGWIGPKTPALHVPIVPLVFLHFPSHSSTLLRPILCSGSTTPTD